VHHWQQVKDAERRGADWGLLTLAAADRVELQSTFQKCRTHVLNRSKQGRRLCCLLS